MEIRSRLVDIGVGFVDANSIVAVEATALGSTIHLSTGGNIKCRLDPEIIMEMVEDHQAMKNGKIVPQEVK